MAAAPNPAPPPVKPAATPPAPAAAPPAAPQQPPAAPPPAPEPAAPAPQAFPQITPQMSKDWQDSDTPGLGIPGRPTGAESMPTSLDQVLKYAEDDDPEIVAKRQIRENLG